MAYRYARTPADVVVDQSTGRPPVSTEPIQMRIWTDMGGQLITAGLLDPDGNPLPGYVPVDSQGRFPFDDVAERPRALWASTPDGQWYRLVAEEMQDRASQIIDEFPVVLDRVTDAEAAADEAVLTSQQALAASTFGPSVPLDLRTAPPRFMARLDVSPSRAIQCVDRDPQSGDWYVGQVSTAGSNPAHETPRIYRLHPSGAATGEEMFLDSGGHGTTIDVERDSDGVWIWIAWNDPAGLIPDSQGRVLCRVRFRPGLVSLTDPDVQVYDTFHPGVYVTCNLDPTHGWITLRLSENGADIYERRRLSEFKVGTDRVYGTLGPFDQRAESLDGAGVIQGFATFGDMFFRQVGWGVSEPDDPAVVHAFDWTTGQQAYSFNAEVIGRDYRGLHYGDKGEPEGLATYMAPDGRVSLLYGISMGATGDRRSEVWAWTQGVDADDAHQIQALMDSRPIVQCGTATITPTAADTPTSTQVTFDRPFPGKPTITATAGTSVAGTTVRGVGATGHSPTGFLCWLTRGNTTSTAVDWIAVYTPEV